MEGVYYPLFGEAPLRSLLFFRPRCHLDPSPEPLKEWARKYGHEEKTEEEEEEEGEEREVHRVAGARSPARL